jgi:hypothetical protein
MPDVMMRSCSLLLLIAADDASALTTVYERMTSSLLHYCGSVRAKSRETQVHASQVTVRYFRP